MGVDLYSPNSWVDGVPHDELEELRRTDPVHWQDMPEGGGYWAVLRHADVVEVARHPGVYSASLGGVVLEDLSPESLEMMRHMLLAMDPPVHARHRQPLAPTFGARVIGEMEERIRAISRRVLAEAAERGDVDFVHDVAAHLPSQVVGELMGLPAEDWPRLHRWAERQTAGQDPDVAGADATGEVGGGVTGEVGGGVDDTMSASVEMAMYFIELAAARRAEPGTREDLFALILATEVDGAPMDDVSVGSFCVQLVTAGNDTTRTMLSSGLDALLDHPDQLEALRADRSGLGAAVEEILRFANPLHYFRRTATTDTVLHGTAIAGGDKVAMLYTSANRDDAVFAEPHRFDIRRDPNPHLSFGIGGHFCLGARLARLEGRVFFDELLSTFGRIERTGAARRVRSNLNNGLKALPLALGR